MRADTSRKRDSSCLPICILRFQPEYRLVKKWQPVLVSSQTTTGRRKQILVAIARGFGVDWWRLRTGQTTAGKLGLNME
jgi:hypothetical protein